MSRGPGRVDAVAGARSTPVRTCIGCRERAAKSELVRIVIGTDATGRPAAVPDPGGTAPGRGAHLHPTTSCFQLAVRRKAFSRALRAREALTSTPVGDHLTSPRTEIATEIATVIDRQETGAGSS
ncbi:YlxR family protein [uncultured Nocardioides sp.]|uniref:YlxR family protein n=1 Tax=uncultured Nocardioides sp. TaxID=198441 RepID=UPI0025FCF33E|nr:YlxR family protein [uncultured Nocardioides sp.]